MFAGRFDAELYKEYRKWIPFISDLYLPIIDSETGDFRSFPFEGSILDQPFMTMQVLKSIQLNYRIYMHDKMQKKK